MKRSDIQPGMPAVFTKDGRIEHVTVVGPADGPFWYVRLADGSRRTALSFELEKRKLPSARAKARVTLMDIVKAYEDVARTQVPRAEVERMMRKGVGR